MKTFTETSEVELMKLKALRYALKFEVYGVRSSETSALVVLKEKFNISGSEPDVFNKVSKIIFES